MGNNICFTTEYIPHFKAELKQDKLDLNSSVCAPI